jgi:hypothetical protein
MGVAEARAFVKLCKQMDVAADLGHEPRNPEQMEQVWRSCGAEAQSITTAILGRRPTLAGETHLPTGPENGVRPPDRDLLQIDQRNRQQGAFRWVPR